MCFDALCRAVDVIHLPEIFIWIRAATDIWTRSSIIRTRRSIHHDLSLFLSFSLFFLGRFSLSISILSVLLSPFSLSFLLFPSLCSLLVFFFLCYSLRNITVLPIKHIFISYYQIFSLSIFLTFYRMFFTS